MRFLLDVCVASSVLRTTLTDLGHEVLSARDGYADASDQALLDLAYREDRVLVTEDKDFGELVFSFRRPHPCIVRLDGLTARDEAAAMRDLIARHGGAMREGAIIVVTGTRVRIRSPRDIGDHKEYWTSWRQAWPAFFVILLRHDQAVVWQSPTVPGR